MPFTTINVSKEIEKLKATDEDFKKSWDESREEYRLIGELTSLRKKKHLTQQKLAALSGNKQQVISRIEKKETIPSIRVFSKILNAMGYKLKIVRM